MIHRPSLARLVIARLLVPPLVAAGVLAQAPTDPRDVHAGLPIPDEGYCDQPRIAVTSAGTWVCVLTTGPGREGGTGQHVVATRSEDRGRSWSPLVDVEPSDPDHPAAYAVVWCTPFDRIYAFYTFNGEAVWSRPGRDERLRSDTHGWFCYRYSDDEGRTWSERHRLPLRVTACDRSNDWQGAVQMFWAIGRPVRTSDGAVVFGLTKLGRYFLEEGEGWFFRCSNLEWERDPEQLAWELLPEGEHGVRRDGFGSVQEEFNVVPLADGGLYCVYRTTLGYPAESYSHDGGRSWSEPEAMRYAPGGRIVRHPRACPKVWRLRDGKYLFWFHNNGGQGFRDRNPAWLCAGVERDGKLCWSEPEIALYGRDTGYEHGRFSYPDLIEDGADYFLAETQKTVARVHTLDADLVEGMWAQITGGPATVPRDALLLERSTGGEAGQLPRLPDPSTGAGFSLGLWLDPAGLDDGALLLDSRDDDGRGVAIRAVRHDGEGGPGLVLRLELGDGERRTEWDSDPLPDGGRHHVVFTVDGGPGIVTVIADGRLCDGAGHRQFGWGRLAEGLADVSSDAPLRLAPAVVGLRVHGRPLRTHEAVACHRAGLVD